MAVDKIIGNFDANLCKFKWRSSNDDLLDSTMGDYFRQQKLR